MSAFKRFLNNTKTFLTDIFTFMKQKRAWWLLPIIIILLLLGLLIILTETTPVGPFIYTLF